VIGFAQVNNFRVPTSYPEDGDDVDGSSDGGSLAGVFRLFGPLDPLINDRPWADIPMIYWMLFHACMTIVTYALLPRISTVSEHENETIKTKMNHGDALPLSVPRNKTPTVAVLHALLFVDSYCF
jgi:hypothetical protein